MGGNEVIPTRHFKAIILVPFTPDSYDQLLLLVTQRQVGQFGVVVVSKKFAVKPALLGGLCLLGAILLAWISPPEGGMGLLGMVEREGRTEVRNTKGRESGDGASREVRSVAEEYLMKAERGMTEDEVRWVVEDFVALGLDVEYPEDKTAEGYLALRKARENWYLAALVSGLRLTDEQEREARKRMGVLREKDYAEFVEYLDGLKSFEHEGEEMKVFDGGKARALMDADIWMNHESHSPGELCLLSKDQLEVTRFRNLNPDDAEGFKDWLVGAAEAEDDSVDSKLSEELEYDVRNMYALGILGWASVDSIFPLTRKQAEMLLGEGKVQPPKDFSKWVMVLQPEQLKMYVLCHPEVVEEIAKELRMKVE